MTGHHSRTLWFRTYRQRILDGSERCRGCGRVDDPRNWLTFDHLIPKAHGTNLTFDNATILCEDCQDEKKDRIWPRLVSLASEETAAPRERRWALLAQVAAFRVADRRKVAGRDVDGCAVTLFLHPRRGPLCVRCPATDGGTDVRFAPGDLAAVLAHLRRHQAAGEHIPGWVFDDVPAWMAQTG